MQPLRKESQEFISNFEEFSFFDLKSSQRILRELLRSFVSLNPALLTSRRLIEII
jgi:hypothetical protein